MKIKDSINFNINNNPKTGVVQWMSDIHVWVLVDGFTYKLLKSDLGIKESVDGWKFYGTEGSLTEPKPLNDGDVIFLYSGDPNNVTYNPNYTGGTFSLFFNVNDLNGNNYLTQFKKLDTDGGTITITQNNNSVSYSSSGLDYYMGDNEEWLEVRVINSNQQIKNSSQSFTVGNPITVTIS